MDKKFKTKNLEMLANVDDCNKTYKTEEQLMKFVFVTIENYLAMLAKNFRRYFLADDILVASYEGVRDPFKNTPDSELTKQKSS